VNVDEAAERSAKSGAAVVDHSVIVHDRSCIRNPHVLTGDDRNKWRAAPLAGNA